MKVVTVITVGTLKESYLREAVAEYEKRLSQFAKVEHTELKEERIADESDPGQIRRALECEGEKILAAVPAGSYTVALCVEGKQMSSPALAEALDRGSDGSGKLCFIIGSSHGLAPAVKSAANLRLSVSALTFPHQLMRVMLAEILYRSFSILAGKSYHK